MGARRYVDAGWSVDREFCYEFLFCLEPRAFSFKLVCHCNSARHTFDMLIIEFCF